MLDMFFALRQLFTVLLGWVFGYPLTLMIRRDPHATVVIGRRGAVFADNTKYYFISAGQAIQNKEHVVFLTSEAVIAGKIEAAGGEALLHPSWRSLMMVLRCGRIVVDMADWVDYGVYPLSRGAQIIQLWHGAPLKHIELDLYHKRLSMLPFWVRPLLAWQKKLLGRYSTYDVVVATSKEFIDQAFERSFFAKSFLPTGYPRNDILLEWPERGSISERLTQINIDIAAMESVRLAHDVGQKIALYVPTFRQGMDSPFDGSVDLTSLSAFAVSHDLVVLIKLHPRMLGCHYINQHQNLIECAPLSDIYPLMAQCDLLITDYSSIYLDFLLLDRPILFFAYDLDQYLAHDRSMYFPYENMTPGAKCASQEQLEEELNTILSAGCQDRYANQRDEVRRFTHENLESGSVARLLNHLG